MTINGSASSTEDTLFDGRVRFHQPARGAGYRVNVDALLLAAFAHARSTAKVAFDLGAGAGGVGLSLLHLRAARRVVLVEIDDVASTLAARNADANGWSSVAEIVCGDVSDVARARRGEADLVVCNPPYFAPGRGRPAKGEARARARTGDLATFVEAARAIAGRRARVCFVYPAPEMATLFTTLRASGLEPKRMRAVHATRDAAARVVMIEAQAAKAGGLRIMAPLFERE